MATERPIISFLTDFGTDGAAATCRGVMLGICPDAQVVDVSHTVSKYAVRDGAFILAAAVPYMPRGVHVAVVDPGVGTERRPVALLVERGDILIGPDNGLLMAAGEILGGISEARILENRELWLPVTSATFHGRDIFAPVAAHLAAGSAEYASLGPRLDVADLVRLPEPEVRVGPGRIETEVTYVDSFGNVRLAGSVSELRDAFGDLEPGRELALEFGSHAGDGVAAERARYAVSFGSVPAGASLLYIDSSGHLAMAENQGNLNARLGTRTGARVTIADDDG
jgi:S-adenosylmethionine hydrolase